MVRNHYNVKFLKGYGFSISVKDSKIILKNCYNPFIQQIKLKDNSHISLKYLKIHSKLQIFILNDYS